MEIYQTLVLFIIFVQVMQLTASKSNFSDIEFESLNQEIPDVADSILKTNIFQ